MSQELIIRIGSENIQKVGALREILLDYPHLACAVVVPCSVVSEVSSQPKTLEEILRGAMNRAKNAFVDCTYSVGLESGLMEVPYSKSGYMELCGCVIYDGKNFHLGLSSAWEFSDPSIMNLIFTDSLDMAQAINKAKLTNDPAIGSTEGAIGILTKGRLNRKAQTLQALRTALIHLDPIENTNVV